MTHDKFWGSLPRDVSRVLCSYGDWCLADHFWLPEEGKSREVKLLIRWRNLDEQGKKSLADAEEIFRDVGTARWHFVAAALTFEPFYPDASFLGFSGSLGSGRSGSRNRYYPPLLHWIEILPSAPQHLTGPRVYTNSEITQLISTLSGTHSIPFPWSRG